MRKITLLFMSMFLALGTVVAQDKEDEPKDFNSPIVRPDSGKSFTSVSQIYLTFSKDVVVTLPESGIPVVNTETKETILIDSLYVNEWMPKTDVILMFEQELVADEKGEEWRCKTIKTPGTYSYTIPAGCIRSTDGDEFPETTFTFSIVGTFDITNYSPFETRDSIKEIVLTFDKEVTSVVLPEEWPLTIYNSSWQTAATIKDAVISEDKKSVTLIPSDTISTPGQYMLSLNEGIIATADGINAYKDLYFNFIDTRPSFSTTYEDGDRVQELSSVFEITFKNIDEVVLNQETLTVYLPSGGEVSGTATYSDNKITVSFNQTFAEEGDYLFHIPEGMFTMDGVANESREINVTLAINKVTPLEIVSVTPADGEIDQIGLIIVSFNQDIQMAYDEDYQPISKEIYLTDATGNKITLTETGNFSLAYNQLEYGVGDTYADNGWELIVEPITAAGTYTLDLSQIVVNYGKDENWFFNAFNGSCNKTCTWTISAGAGIKATEAANAEQAIYDLLGRRVEKITGAGIYIVNGKKMVVK